MASIMRSALQRSVAHCGAAAARSARAPCAAWAASGSSATTTANFHSAAPTALNVHEYSSMELMQKFGVPTPQGRVATTPEQAEEIYSSAALGGSHADVPVVHVA